MIEQIRLTYPLFFRSGNKPKSAKDLVVERCPNNRAVELNELWHSRLPIAYPGMYSFWAHYQGVIYAVAIWNNCSSRMLPNDWVELRRLAIANDAPKYTATRMISKMIKWLKNNTSHSHAISYQDTAVHDGTIYKASNWKIEYVSEGKVRDRGRMDNGRVYRTNTNGDDVDHSTKIRWGIDL